MTGICLSASLRITNQGPVFHLVSVFQSADIRHHQQGLQRKDPDFTRHEEERSPFILQAPGLSRRLVYVMANMQNACRTGKCTHAYLLTCLHALTETWKRAALPPQHWRLQGPPVGWPPAAAALKAAPIREHARLFFEALT